MSSYAAGLDSTLACQPRVNDWGIASKIASRPFRGSESVCRLRQHSIPLPPRVGSGELLAGLLLIISATSMLGALICLFDMIEVFALTMTYDL